MDNEILFKICKTCNESKELSKYRPTANHCKHCANKKDAANRLKRNKLYYERNRERVIKHNLDYYCKIKELKNSIIESVLCA